MNNYSNLALSKSKGRIFKEANSLYRTPFQRDRDRIIHSASFRRLKHKTQVFVNTEGDHYRTRITHSMEVAQVARSIAKHLGLNDDLAETLSLAHDLGHTPFGHAGQDALNACMKEFGGFEHNLQSIRIVDCLEERYASFSGLNLTFETREGIIKHCSRNNALNLGELGERFINGEKPGIEAQIANIADEIAYNNHDIDDGLRAELLDIETLRNCNLFNIYYEKVKTKWNNLTDDRLRHEIIRRMINCVVSDLIKNSEEMINQVKPIDVEQVRKCGKSLITMSDSIAIMHKALKKHLRLNLYKHRRVMSMSNKAKEIVRFLFDAYMEDKNLLTKELQFAINQTGDVKNGNEVARIVADYIAGMTDRFAISEAERIKRN